MNTPWSGPVIDAHHHVWEPRKNNYPWLSGDTLVPHRYGDYSPVKKTYLPDDFRRDAAGQNIAATVYVDAEWDPTDPIGETRYVTSLHERFDLPNAIVAQAWLDRADVADVLAEQAKFYLVRSVRHKPGGATSLAEAKSGVRGLMSNDRWRRGYELLAKHNLHFDLQVPWWNLAEAVDLVRSFPQTTLIINHTGVPNDRAPETKVGWRAGMAALAAEPNVVVKISGLCLPGQPWRTEDHEWIIGHTIALFGPDRVMFGSNYPVDGLMARYDQIFGTFREITAPFTDAEKRAMFHNNAIRIYRPVKSGQPVKPV